MVYMMPRWKKGGKSESSGSSATKDFKQTGLSKFLVTSHASKAKDDGSTAGPQQVMQADESTLLDPLTQQVLKVPSDDGTSSTEVDILMELISAVDSNTTDSFIAKAAGTKLTAENLSQVQASLDSFGEMTVPEKVNLAMSKESSQMPSKKLPPLTKNDDKTIKALQEAIEKGNVDMKSSLGNKFYQELSKDDAAKAQYAGMKRDEAKQYRLKWANEAMQSYEARREVVTSWGRTTTHKYKYRTLGRLICDLGGWGDASAVKGACTAACKCLALGAPYVAKHPQTEMLEFVVVEMSWQEEFQQKWTELKTRMGALGDNSAAASEQTPIEKEAKPLQQQKKRKSEEQHEKDEKVSKDDGDQSMEKEEKKGKKPKPNDDDPKTPKEHSINLKKSLKLKQELTSASHKAHQLIATIDTDPKWQWARSEKKLQLVQANDDMKESLTPWLQQFVLSEKWLELKKTTTQQQINEEFKIMVDMVGPKIEKVHKVVFGLLQAQSIMM